MQANKLIEYNNEAVVKKSIQKLENQYFDNKVFNNIISINNDKSAEIKQNVVSISAKRNHFENLTICDSKIIGSAFSGSRFSDFTFKNCEITGNGFVCSDFYKFTMISKTRNPYSSNNFSQSYFEQCQFNNIHIKQSTWLNSRVTTSNFYECVIESCTFEGATFKNCTFKNCLMYSTNLDYMVLDNTNLQKVTLPFYQFAYIIGATTYLQDKSDSTIDFRCGEKTIAINEYKECIPDLIHYYFEKKEYFPMCNLLLALKEFESAKKFALIGIEKALNEKNYRLVKYFCILGKYNNILDYNLITQIKEKIDTFLMDPKLCKKQLNEALLQTAEINALINERITNNTSLQIEIQTNIVRGCADEHEKIEKLISDCIYIIDTPNLQAAGHTVTELSYCPITLMFEIIGAVANLATIGSALQEFFVNMKKNKSKDSREIAKAIREKYSNVTLVDMDTRIKLAKTEIEKSMLELKNYKGSKTTKKYDDFISNITQKIIGDVENILDKDMLVLKIDN